MTHRKFLSQLAHERIHDAIHDAERKTSGEIRVMVSHRRAPDPVVAAQQAFLRLGMQQTKHRNAVLIFLAPRSRTFAVVGDEAVHARCGDEFWQELAGAMSGHFKRGAFTDGVLHGISRAGELLAAHFPRELDDHNELPDDVIEDGPGTVT
ncbi:MAG TPA: TPM domain-containing protein [Opitutaceae bacterium]|nr:TPM domain-containing protein [Opitutaceae bacterium]